MAEMLNQKGKVWKNRHTTPIAQKKVSQENELFKPVDITNILTHKSL